MRKKAWCWLLGVILYLAIGVWYGTVSMRSVRVQEQLKQSPDPAFAAGSQLICFRVPLWPIGLLFDGVDAVGQCFVPKESP